jgi:hypothetical protein
MTTSLIYTLGADGLSAALYMASEIYSEVGIVPDYIRYGDICVSYNWKDAKSFERGGMSESDYIAAHRIMVEGIADNKAD